MPVSPKYKFFVEGNNIPLLSHLKNSVIAPSVVEEPAAFERKETFPAPLLNWLCMAIVLVSKPARALVAE